MGMGMGTDVGMMGRWDGKGIRVAIMGRGRARGRGSVMGGIRAVVGDTVAVGTGISTVVGGDFVCE